MLPWLLLVVAELIMIGLVVRDPDADRDDIVEFVVLAFLGGVGAFVMGAILDAEPWLVAGAGSFAILGAWWAPGFGRLSRFMVLGGGSCWSQSVR